MKTTTSKKRIFSPDEIAAILAEPNSIQPDLPKLRRMKRERFINIECEMFVRDPQTRVLAKQACMIAPIFDLPWEKFVEEVVRIVFKTLEAFDD